MIKEETVKTFKKLNAGDVMGVVRTLYPNIEPTISKKRAKKKA